MKRKIESCPTCAAPVEFRLSTALVTVCEYCHTVVARSDKVLEDLGKVADLVDTGSPLERGMTGQFENHPFEVVGLVQYQHPAGGVWTEWYLRFPNDKVKWLAEAQGRWTILSRKRLPDKFKLPEFESLQPGDEVAITDRVRFVVAEVGVAKASSAAGDIPWSFKPHSEHRFADLQGSDSLAATIEYDESVPQLFLGRDVELAELHLSGKGWSGSPPDTAKSTALQLSCPQCAGPLQLVAPDQSERVCCPNCHAMLSCDQGNLKFLTSLKVKVISPVIPLGTVGKLQGVEYTVIGFMGRYAVWQERKYPWTEYLLYNVKNGFRWLVHNKGHWSFVEPVSVAETRRFSSNRATYRSKSFSLYDKGTAYVSYVAGEFYWRVSIDERVETEDYISPPQMLSFETSHRGPAETDVTDAASAASNAMSAKRASKNRASAELNVSLGTYVSVEEIEQAFKIKNLQRAFGVGTIQPSPRRGDVWFIWIVFSGLIFLLDKLFRSMSKSYGDFYFFASIVGLAIPPVLVFLASRAFEMKRWEDSDYSPYVTEGDDE